MCPNPLCYVSYNLRVFSRVIVVIYSCYLSDKVANTYHCCDVFNIFFFFVTTNRFYIIPVNTSVVMYHLRRVECENLQRYNASINFTWIDIIYSNDYRAQITHSALHKRSNCSKLVLIFVLWQTMNMPNKYFKMFININILILMIA